jgi:hypothetical protein
LLGGSHTWSYARADGLGCRLSPSHKAKAAFETGSVAGETLDPQG